MPKTLLAVSHLRQRAEADCVPVCAQMVLAYLGRAESYERLAEVLGTRWFGTPSENVSRLERLGLRVTLAELPLADIIRHLESGRPVIAFVNTADLPYWATATDHALVVIGADEQTVYLNDPYFPDAPRQAPHAAFELSQLRFDNRCAVIEV